MKLLVSPRCIEGARAAILGGADIIDCKNPLEGSLGANFPWVIKEMKGLLENGAGIGKELSAALGDMPNLPGTASLAATGLASLGVNYIKVGIYGPKTIDDANKLLQAVVKSARLISDDIKVVAAGYADYSRLNTSINPLDLVDVAAETGCDVVMVDTGIKDDKGLFDFMDKNAVIDFCKKAKEKGLEVALAGKLKEKDIPVLKSINPDIIGVRSIVCDENDRIKGIINSDLVKKIMQIIN
ncbi:MAG: (5-formylfuran-3-yl)methyl phosphate synthase [Promethearchaeota archaeon]